MDSTIDIGAALMEPLATIGGAAYYELAIVVRRQDNRSTIIGLMADWPILHRNIRIAELERLVAALQRQTAESEHHCQELIARNEDLARQLAEAQRVPPAVAAAATGIEPTKAPTDKRKKCPYCNARPKAGGLQAHLDREHPNRPPDIVAVPSEPEPAIVLADPPWRCASCDKNTFARSVADPSRCISCVAHEAPTNGHAVAA
jgi:hypothetical protein